MPLRSSRGRRMRSASTRAKEQRAMDNQLAATAALREGRELRVSNRTDLEAGTVHTGLARYLVRMHTAQYPADPAREGWRDMTRIKARA